MIWHIFQMILWMKCENGDWLHRKNFQRHVGSSVKKDLFGLFNLAHTVFTCQEELNVLAVLFSSKGRKLQQHPTPPSIWFVLLRSHRDLKGNWEVETGYSPGLPCLNTPYSPAFFEVNHDHENRLYMLNIHELYCKSQSTENRQHLPFLWHLLVFYYYPFLITSSICYYPRSICYYDPFLITSSKFMMGRALHLNHSSQCNNGKVPLWSVDRKSGLSGRQHIWHIWQTAHMQSICYLM